MSSTYKNLGTNDKVVTKTLLYENVPLTGTIVSGAYATAQGNESNVYRYGHGMFQTVYDYPYSSASANSLFDITAGYSKQSPSYSNYSTQNSSKVNIYNQMAKVLNGVDPTGSVLKFDVDGNTSTTSTYIDNAIFLTFSRLLVKDEIKKGSFNLRLNLAGTGRSYLGALTGTIVDYSGTLNPPSYGSNSPVGEYGILYLTENNAAFPNGDKKVGLIYYQAGVAVLNANIFAQKGATDPATSYATSSLGQLLNGDVMHNLTSSYSNIQTLFTSASIDTIADSVRTRINNIQLQNTTELNSTIYFLRLDNDEFNYSSNPTYVSASSIRVKNGNPMNSAVSYITTAGLYSSQNELMAVAKLSEPIKKSEDQSLILRVRLDY